jgi:hypothetical protein
MACGCMQPASPVSEAALPGCKQAMCMQHARVFSGGTHLSCQPLHATAVTPPSGSVRAPSPHLMSPALSPITPATCIHIPQLGQHGQQWAGCPLPGQPPYTGRKHTQPADVTDAPPASKQACGRHTQHNTLQTAAGPSRHPAQHTENNNPQSMAQQAQHTGKVQQAGPGAADAWYNQFTAR